MKIHKPLSGKLVLWLFHTTFLTLLLIATSGQAQQINKPSDWQVYYENNEVRVEYKYQSCNLPWEGSHNENVYLKFVNKTTTLITVSWRNELWYNGKCHGCDGNIEFKNQLQLSPGSTQQGSCSTSSPKELVILSKLLNVESKTKLSGFDLKDVTVKINN
jgi:hypothetical protein